MPTKDDEDEDVVEGLDEDLYGDLDAEEEGGDDDEDVPELEDEDDLDDVGGAVTTQPTSEIGAFFGCLFYGLMTLLMMGVTMLILAAVVKWAWHVVFS